MPQTSWSQCSHFYASESTRTSCLCQGLPILWEHWGQLLPKEAEPSILPSPGTVASAVSQSHILVTLTYAVTSLSHTQAYTLLSSLTHKQRGTPHVSRSEFTPHAFLKTLSQYPDLESHVLRVTVGPWLQERLLMLSGFLFDTKVCQTAPGVAQVLLTPSPHPSPISQMPSSCPFVSSRESCSQHSTFSLTCSP